MYHGFRMGHPSSAPQIDERDERLSELKRVQSYQDDDPTIDIESLSLGTHLNIKANELATQGLDQLDSKPKV